ncbi:MAG: glycosyltransferase family 4 protein [Candidatus Marinimicrobia bacterium]|nr:glycosyltransferase family 4 protein [Candidatus Neomarinimicrobiota bacterium]
MIAVVSCGHRPDDERIYHRQIKSLLKAGYEIQYFTRFDGDMNLSESGLRHSNFPRSENSVRTFAKLVEAELVQTKPDIVHIHEFELLSMARNVKKSAESKILYDVHDTLIAMWDTVSSRKGIIKKLINTGLYYYEKRNLKYVDHVILANPSFEINRYEKTGLATTVVPNFPLLSFLPEEYGERSGKKILYQGLLSEDRGIDILIQAFRLVLKAHPDAELMLLGPAKTEEYRNELKKEISRNSNQIQLLDEIPHKEVWRMMSEAKVGVIPSLDSPRVRFDTPTKLFEYMASGCAVIATDLKPVRHHARDSILYAAPNDIADLAEKIIAILDSDILYNELTGKGQKLIKEKQHWGKVENTFLEVFEQLNR